MYITQAIRTAQEPAAIYFLVTAYVETVAHDTGANDAPRWAAAGPLRNRQDIRRCLQALRFNSAMCSVGRAIPEDAVIREAAAVFEAALESLDRIAQAAGAGPGIPARCAA